MKLKTDCYNIPILSLPEVFAYFVVKINYEQCSVLLFTSKNITPPIGF